ncbi:MAG: carbonic anhydrase family protein, partial [bacterium]
MDVDGSALVPTPDVPVALSWGSTSLRATNQGHAIRYEVEPGSTATYAGTTYDLKQFHFHSLAEHSINGGKSDVEIHLVHEDPADANRRLVVAVFLFAAIEDADVTLMDPGGPLLMDEALALPVSDTPTDLAGSIDLDEVFP